MTTQLAQINYFAAKLAQHEEEVFERAVLMSQIKDTAKSLDLTIKQLQKLAKNPREYESVGGSRGQAMSIDLKVFELRGTPTARIAVGWAEQHYGPEHGRIDTNIVDNPTVEAALSLLIREKIRNLQHQMRQVQGQAERLASFG